MKENRFTPGPWTNWGTTIYSPGNGVVCKLSEPHPESDAVRYEYLSVTSPYLDEAYANGDLIRAAPDLLAALVAALGHETSSECQFDHHGYCQAHNSDTKVCWVKMAEDAIAKAKGE